MSKTTDSILNRLNSILPLPARQSALPPGLQAVHRAFLMSLVERGKVPADDELKALAPGGDVAGAMRTLAANDLVVVDKSGAPVGAYPVTLEKTPHRVRVEGRDLYAMCAFDAFGIAPVFGKHVETWTRCPITGQEIFVEQQGNTVVTVKPGPDIQIGVAFRDPQAVAAHSLCSGMIALSDRPSAVAWQAGHADTHEFAPLDEAIDMATRFFRPLLTGEALKLGAPVATKEAVHA